MSLKKSVFLAFIFMGSITQSYGALTHGVSLFGKPKYDKNFTHFDYVNGHAPKGGTLRVKVTGNFNSLNPHIITGLPAEGHYLTTESLLKRSADEPFSMYGRIAEKVDVSRDYRSVRFLLNKQARFHDGSAITTEDVVFSFETLKKYGRPQMGLFYTQIEKIDVKGPLEIVFHFKTRGDRQLALLIGYMPILSKAYYSKFPFSKASLSIPLGSGPYTVEKVIPGKSIHYKRVKNYWGENLPVNRGFYNFDTIVFEYFRDENASLEAFKAGVYDLREEKNLNFWSTSYGFPAVKRGEVILDSAPLRASVGMFGFVFNTRRDLFKDINVRKALTLALDIDWLNRIYYHGAYDRIQSFYGLRHDLPHIFGDHLSPRDRLHEAYGLLKKAGWKFEGEELIHTKTGRPFIFQILVYTRDHERLALNLARTLKKIGITVTVRHLDPSQYEKRRQNFDYDMIMNMWNQSLAAGREQQYYWGSVSARQEGSQNYAGIANRNVDKLIGKLTHVNSLYQYNRTVKKLDMELLKGYYILPLFEPQRNFYAYWDRFGKPNTIPQHGFRNVHWWATQVWWSKEDKGNAH